MKYRILIIFALVAALLLASWAIARARTGPYEKSSSYQVESGLVTGEGYQLLNLTWQIGGALQGEGYFMPDPGASPSAASGCCCTFLPCVKR